MLGSSILACIYYLINNPFTSLFLQPIQPQRRLRPENNQQVVLSPDGSWNNIITGVYGVPPLLKVHDRNGVVKWSWGRRDVTQKLPSGIKHGLKSKANDATDMKWMRNGTCIAAIYSDLVLLINHTPDDPETDKQITWAVSRQNEFLWNAHAVEPLPGDLVAVATTGSNPWDGILVFNASSANPIVDDPPVLQNLTGLRAIHALIWDETESMLWAAGTDAAADGSDNIPAYGTVQGYPFDAAAGKLRHDDSLIFRLPQAHDQKTEWGKEYTWWTGPHDLVPVPNRREFLLSDDRDLHLFDLTTRNFTDEGASVVHEYLRGFQTTTSDRHGYKGTGQYEELPRSDLKGFSLAPDGSFIYIQALWRGYRGFHTNIVVDGVKSEINEGDEIYRSRWFGDIPGWPKPVT